MTFHISLCPRSIERVLPCRSITPKTEAQPIVVCEEMARWHQHQGGSLSQRFSIGLCQSAPLLLSLRKQNVPPLAHSIEIFVVLLTEFSRYLQARSQPFPMRTLNRPLLSNAMRPGPPGTGGHIEE